jgi:hypothetical protein
MPPLGVIHTELSPLSFTEPLFKRGKKQKKQTKTSKENGAQKMLSPFFLFKRRSQVRQRVVNYTQKPQARQKKTRCGKCVFSSRRFYMFRALKTKGLGRS